MTLQPALLAPIRVVELLDVPTELKLSYPIPLDTERCLVLPRWKGLSESVSGFSHHCNGIILIRLRDTVLSQQKVTLLWHNTFFIQITYQTQRRSFVTACRKLLSYGDLTLVDEKTINYASIHPPNKSQFPLLSQLTAFEGEGGFNNSKKWSILLAVHSFKKINSVPIICCSVLHTLCPSYTLQKPRIVRSRYGAWYLPTSLWKSLSRDEVCTS